MQYEHHIQFLYVLTGGTYSKCHALKVNYARRQHYLLIYVTFRVKVILEVTVNHYT